MRITVLILLVGCGRFDFSRLAPIDGAADAGIDAPFVPWSLIQTAGAAATSTAIAPSGAGHLIVVAIQTAGVTGVADDAGNTYVDIPTSHAIGTAGADGLVIWYAKDSRAGATTITPTGSTIAVVAVWEVAGIRTDAALDAANHLDNQAATTTPVGPSLTTAVAGEIVISATIMANGVAGIHAGNAFTNDLETNGNGWAHLASSSAPAGSYQAEWDQDAAGVYCSTTAAFEIGP